MAGETELRKLLEGLSPQLHAADYVFLSFKEASYGDQAHLEPIASVMEAEGLTLVVSKSAADQHELPYDGVFKAISLKVHSSLEAVGLTAAFSTALSQAGISANVLAGYYHDHILVQRDVAQHAVEVLSNLSKSDSSAED